MKKKLILSLTCLAALSASAVLAMPDKAAKPAAANSAQPAEVLSGKVIETMNSGGYTYVNLQKKNGEKVWVAAPETSVKAGSQVSFKGGMEMVNFESKSLKRKFDKINFADGLASGAATAPAAKSAGQNDAAGSPGSKGAASEKDTKISVPKATGPNATTVQGAFASSAKLNKKKVVIRGKVVKVSARIMDRNWVHIQDGTGSQAKGNHNLVFTSKEMVNVGDIVTASGTLAKDKDFGGGYKYSAIVENATFKK
ncbi:MAG: OB-fold nucleic acid binding domain-containing protein [Deltaproteobacteria bacterium]|nr:OB-fold nucleic acid binding domain-containing protein [Deltaproteobacteria bacterium]